MNARVISPQNKLIFYSNYICWRTHYEKFFCYCCSIVHSSGAAYGEVTPVLVRWFYKVEACIIITYVAVYVVTYNGMDPGAAIVTRPSQ